MRNVSNGPDWPQWRGPSRNGTTQTTLPWPDILPKATWTAPVGIGYASPIVADGRVYCMDRTAVQPAGLERIFALDQASGKLLWEYKYPSTFVAPDPTAGKGPNATPLYHKGTIFSLGLGGMMTAVDARTGKLKWRHDCAKEYGSAERIPGGGDANFPICGVSSSALADGDDVIFNVGGAKAGSIAAFRASDGVLQWSVLKEKGSYTSPVFTEMHGQQLLMSFSGKRLAGIDRASRQILWESPYTAMYEQTICNAIPVGNRLIISGEARPTEAVDVMLTNGKYELKSVWKNAEISTYMTNPVTFDDALVGFDMRSRRAVCVAIANGATLWTSPRIAKQIINVTVVGKHLVIVSDAGELIIADATRKAWTPLHTYTISESGSLWSMPCFAGNQVFVRDQKTIRCWTLSR